MNASSISSTRRYDFDWLRVLLILTVFVFHSMRFFNLESWEMQNATTYLFPEIMIIFISRWMMPAIILISGIATFYAIGKRRAGPFLKDRSLRLLVPLLVGLVTHIPLQIYLSQLRNGQYSGSFWQWLPGLFNGSAGFGGVFDLPRGHLWYLEVLFIISLLCLPLCIWLRRSSGQRLLSWVNSRLSSPGGLYLMVLPILVLSATLDPENGSALGREYGGWNLPSYVLFYLAGFAIASSPAMQASIRRMRIVSLVAGLAVFFSGSGLLLVLDGSDAAFGTPLYLLWTFVSSFSCWACALAILGFGMQRLTTRSPLLDYANEAVMPFYILHQTVLYVVGFYVLDWPIPDLAKWAIILVLSFAIILALYEFLIRRLNLLRILFGMKPVSQPKVVQVQVAQVT